MKLAVIFPGIGYRMDRPLLYESKKLAMKYGYGVLEVRYEGFPENIKGNREKMMQAYQVALEQTEQILEGVEFGQYENLLFISKSIGTTVSAVYADKYHLHTNNVFYTPVAEFFQVVKQNNGIVFHGTQDPWVTTETVRLECAKYGLPLYVTEGANHSLETGDTKKDAENLRIIMNRTEQYIKSC